MACDCKNVNGIKEIRERDFKSSDLVFYGELLNSDSKNFTYSFKVFEIFKGNLSSDFVHGIWFSSCSKLPREDGKWLVYANFRDGELIEISICSASRPESNPNCIAYPLPSSPPPPAEVRDILDQNASDSFMEEENLEYEKNIKLWNISHQIRIHQDFKDELYLLRKKTINTNN